MEICPLHWASASGLLKAIGCHPHTALALQRHAEPPGCQERLYLPQHVLSDWMGQPEQPGLAQEQIERFPIPWSALWSQDLVLRHIVGVSSFHLQWFRRPGALAPATPFRSSPVITRSLLDLHHKQRHEVPFIGEHPGGRLVTEQGVCFERCSRWSKPAMWLLEISPELSPHSK